MKTGLLSFFTTTNYLLRVSIIKQLVLATITLLISIFVAFFTSINSNLLFMVYCIAAIVSVTLFFTSFIGNKSMFALRQYVSGTKTFTSLILVTAFYQALIWTCITIALLCSRNSNDIFLTLHTNYYLTWFYELHWGSMLIRTLTIVGISAITTVSFMQFKTRNMTILTFISWLITVVSFIMFVITLFTERKFLIIPTLILLLLLLINSVVAIRNWNIKGGKS